MSDRYSHAVCAGGAPHWFNDDPSEPVYDDYNPAHPGWRDRMRIISKKSRKAARRYEHWRTTRCL